MTCLKLSWLFKIDVQVNISLIDKREVKVKKTEKVWMMMEGKLSL